MRPAEDVAREIAGSCEFVVECPERVDLNEPCGACNLTADIAAALRAYAAEAVGEAVKIAARPQCSHGADSEGGCCACGKIMLCALEALRREIEGGTDAE